MKKIYLLLIVVFINLTVFGQVSITATGVALTQNFDGLGTANFDLSDNASIAGVYAFRTSGNAAPNVFTAQDGNSNTGRFNNYGTTGAADRALGSVSSGTPGTLFYGVRYVNNTGSLITSLSVTYTGEQWRNGGNSSVQTLAFDYIQAATITDLTTGTYTSVTALNFNSPIATATISALDGNDPANRTVLTATISVNIPNGQEIMIRWMDINDAGNDHGFGIDDLSVTANSGTLPVSIINFVGEKSGTTNHLHWSTASEFNNLGFEVQHSADGINYATIGFVNTLAINGNSSDVLNYNFIDNNIIGKKHYYRLRQVDIDNRSKLSNIVLIKGENPLEVMIYGIFPNPSSSIVNVLIATPARERVTLIVSDMAGRIVSQKAIAVEIGNNTIPVDISLLNKGSYLVRLVCENGCNSNSKFLKL